MESSQSDKHNATSKSVLSFGASPGRQDLRCLPGSGRIAGVHRKAGRCARVGIRGSTTFGQVSVELRPKVENRGKGQ